MSYKNEFGIEYSTKIEIQLNKVNNENNVNTILFWVLAP